MKTPNPTPETPTRSECFKALACLYLATDQRVADDLNAKVRSYIFDLERALAEAKREIERLKAERQWHPIASAPKDGTPVLGWAEDWIHPDYNREGVRECFCDGNGDWQSPDWNNYQDTYETGTGTPTHWMPIPRASIEIARKPCAIDAAHTTQEGQG